MPAGSQMIKPKCVNDALECPTRERPFQVALRMFTASNTSSGNVTRQNGVSA
jgi:hypothetical protein